MSEIALYNALTKLGLDHEAAKEAVVDVASSKDVATKSDIKDMATKSDIKDMATKSDIKDMATKTDIAELETRLVKQIYAVAGIIIVANIAAVGLMFRLFMV